MTMQLVPVAAAVILGFILFVVGATTTIVGVLRTGRPWLRGLRLQLAGFAAIAFALGLAMVLTPLEEVGPLSLAAGCVVIGMAILCLLFAARLHLRP